MRNVTDWLNVLNEYFRGTVYLVVLCFFILFLIYNRKNNISRKIIVSIFVFIISYPLVYKICESVSLDSVAYRLLWIFPLSAIVAVLITAIGEKKAEKKSTWTFLLIVEVLMVGSVGLQVNAWKLPDNLYLLDDEVIQIGDIIENDCEKEVSIVVGEVMFMQQIRQYSSRVCWGYKTRTYMMNADASHTENASYRIVGAIQNQYYPECMNVIDDLEELNVDYVVIYKANPFQNYLPEMSYETIGETEQYKVLRMNYEYPHLVASSIDAIYVLNE